MTGLEFKELRKACKLTQDELAKLFDYSSRQIRYIEKSDKVRGMEEFAMRFVHEKPVILINNLKRGQTNDI